MPDQDKLTILFLAANPVDTAPLQLDEELRAIDQELRKTEYRDRFDLRSAWAVRYGDVQELLLRYKPHIVHFSGHGSSAGAIILQNAEGLSNQVSPDTLAALFGILKDNIRCVVLNACYSQLQAEGIAASIDCVVGMQRAVLDKVAIEFAAGFYLGLGFGRSVKTAFDLGCNRIGLAGKNVAQRHLTTTPAAQGTTADDTIPQLIALRTEPLQIVLVNPEVAVPPSSPAADAKEEAVLLATMPPAEPDAKPPYQGLAYFDVADADRFFGRAALTAELVDYLKEHRFLAVVGASGSGKSSVVRAGVVTALRAGAITGSAHWAVHIVTPHAHPLESLAVELIPKSERKTVVTGLMDDMAADPRSLHLQARQTVGQDGRGNRLLLIVDQFEELFTLCKDPGERKAFVDNLLTAATSDGVTSVVLTLRADFYAHCAQFDSLRLAVQDCQKYIGAMTSVELRDAIVKPAARGHWDFEPGLVDAILADVAAEPGALPLLSEALTETWRNRRGRTLTFAGYHAAGGVQGAIGHKADSVFTSLPPEQQAIARNIFVSLTALGEGTQDTRRRVPLAELVGSGAQAEQATEVLKVLEDARLVTAEREQAAAGEAAAETVYVDVTHEALIREWKTLDEWLHADRDGLRIHRRLTEAAQEWVALGRDPGALFRGALLAQAGEWAAAHGEELNDLEQEFLAGSQERVASEQRDREAARQRELEQAQALAAEQQRRAEEQALAAAQLRERNRRFLVALVAAVALAVVAGAFFLLAQSNAEQATRAQATAQANADLAQQQLDALAGERLLYEAREYKNALTVTRAISSFQAAAAYPKLGINLNDEISDTLRFVATTWVQEGERLLRASSGAAFTPTVPYSPSVVIQPEYLAWAAGVADQAPKDAAALAVQPSSPLTLDQPPSPLPARLPKAVSPLRQQAIISATALFSQALALKPPADTPVYVLIPPGEFRMGSRDSDSLEQNDEKPQHSVALWGYWLQRTEVTNGHYKRCVDAGACEPLGDLFWDKPRAARLPVTSVDWYQANTYAAWVGGRLPTEAEWERACRGTGGNIYPWGDWPPAMDLLNYGYAVASKTDVGTFPPGMNGLYDMAGNVSEWTSSQYLPYLYNANDGREVPAFDRDKEPPLSESRTLRGGSFIDFDDEVRCADRYYSNPVSSSNVFGFRVVSPGF